MGIIPIQTWKKQFLSNATAAFGLKENAPQDQEEQIGKLLAHVCDTCQMNLRLGW
ncbi:MAG: hypothetical protein K2X86_03925 [Cytophagaceae bacterium]|nr:hypothetical protein [Cytophagaceae bacterium]